MSWAVGHATTGYGIYLDEDETHRFVMTYGSAHGLFEQSYLDDDDEDDDDERDIDEDAVREGIERDMEGMFLDDDCVTDCCLTDMAGNDGYDAMDGLFLFCEKRGGIIASDASNLYSSMDELAGELRASYGDCLPPDFDYAGHVRLLCVSREW